jgi:hypothetical protein
MKRVNLVMCAELKNIAKITSIFIPGPSSTEV